MKMSMQLIKNGSIRINVSVVFINWPVMNPNNPARTEEAFNLSNASGFSDSMSISIYQNLLFSTLI